MASAKAAVVPMPWNSVSPSSPDGCPPLGYWRETSGLASMKSATRGCCNMSHWTSNFCARGSKPATGKKGQLFPTTAGTPQGGLISPLLSNFALDGMEAAVKAVATRDDKVNFVRYADDFVVTGANRELLEQKVKPALTAFLEQRGLELSEQKTVITHIQTGFNFLGHTVRKYGDKLLITPAKSKVQSLRQKISKRIQ